WLRPSSTPSRASTGRAPRSCWWSRTSCSRCACRTGGTCWRPAASCSRARAASCSPTLTHARRSWESAPYNRPREDPGMQIRLSPEAAAAANHGRMTVDEFLARFPEVPRDLKGEPVLAQYVDAFGLQLREARKPSPCMGAEGGAAGAPFTPALV